MAAKPAGTATAAAFRRSVGVATHPTFFDTVHSREAEIAKVIAGLGIRRVRNDMAVSTDAGWNGTVWKNMRAWGEAGVTSSWMVDRCSVAHFGSSIHAYLDRIAELDQPSWAVEGTNEVDHFCTGGFPQAERDHVKALWEAVRNHPSALVRGLKVIGPSFAHNAQSQLGDISSYIDFGNTHPYSGGDQPTPEHVRNDGINAYRPCGGAKKVVVTECGYHTALNARSGQAPVDERTQAVYTARTYLEHFHAGIPFTAVYEAVDLRPDPGRVEPEYHFGLLNNDLTPKPAALTVKRLLEAVGNSAPATVRPLMLGVGEQPADLRGVAFQRRGGSYALALWRNVASWDRTSRKPIRVPLASVVLELPDATSVTAGSVVGGGSVGLPISNGRVQLVLGDEPVVVKVR